MIWPAKLFWISLIMFILVFGWGLSFCIAQQLPTLPSDHRAYGLMRLLLISMVTNIVLYIILV